ncbi:hypothetical protein BHM03_00049061 [Ensete ventricosum]|uniref:Uncharacterized protein n=1 Tax=Ensete ventricosum TaxID=4639 RepID=A0A445MLD9_ENSVE|nr:hypothetical protein BHM03_00049061 [Ensete ventricosum]
MRLRTRQECVRSLLGWRNGVHQKKIETYRKIVGGLDDAVGARRAFARTSPKVSGRLLGTRQEIARGRPRDSLLEKPEIADLQE